MALWQGKSRRKPTGGRLISNKGKRRFEIGTEKQFTKIGATSLKRYRTAGGGVKVRMLSAEYANVVSRKSNVVTKVKILGVKTNPADPNYVQRSLINRGATIRTELGDAVITSRPGQDGAVNAVLIE
ncbi:MAG: 30S ribosomal protein S8e [Methanomassiliicoccaceae archaeon]|jgi:small subunit ribosomal protein S8e|nr:30S ribosomal protein S8e [Methanomassiliicoccaceae archaeon]